MNYSLWGLISYPNNVKPNPATDFIHIELNKETFVDGFLIFNQLGHLVLETKDLIIDISHLPNGLYFFFAEIDGKMLKMKFVKQQ